MSRNDIPTEEEIETIRANFKEHDGVGSVVLYLLNAVVFLKKIYGHEDERATIPALPPTEDGDDTFIGVAPPPPILSYVMQRCAACLYEFIPSVSPAICPMCLSPDVYPLDHEDWPCGNCGKSRDGLDACICSPRVDVDLACDEV